MKTFKVYLITYWINGNVHQTFSLEKCEGVIGHTRFESDDGIDYVLPKGYFIRKRECMLKDNKKGYRKYLYNALGQMCYLIEWHTQPVIVDGDETINLERACSLCGNS